MNGQKVEERRSERRQETGERESGREEKRKQKQKQEKVKVKPGTERTLPCVTRGGGTTRHKVESNSRAFQVPKLLLD